MPYHTNYTLTCDGCGWKLTIAVPNEDGNKRCPRCLSQAFDFGASNTIWMGPGPEPVEDEDAFNF